MRASSAWLVRFSLRLAPEISSTEREHRLEVAEALQQVGRGLVADARDAGDVVRRVALEAVEVGDQLGRDAVAVDHRLVVVELRVGDAARRSPSPCTRDSGSMSWKASRSPVTIVTGMPSSRALRGDRGDHVVGLEARRPRRCGSRTRRRAARGAATAACSRSGRDWCAWPCTRRRSPCGPLEPASQTTIVGFVPCSVSIFTSIEAKPKIAFVGKPGRRRDRLGQREERAVGQRVAVDQVELVVPVGRHAQRP